MQLSSAISAVVTGGASGLGGATAQALAAKGVKVAIFDLNEAVGSKHAAEIGAKFYRCDVTNEASIDAAFAAARKDIRNYFDILVRYEESYRPLFSSIADDESQLSP